MRRRFGTAIHRLGMGTVLKRECCEMFSGRGSMEVDRFGQNHGVEMECLSKTGRKSHMNPNDDDIQRISNLKPGRVDCLDGVGMEISPMLMPGST